MTSTVIFDMNQIIYRSLPLTQRGQVESGRLPIEAMPEAIETFLSFYDQGCKIVIISSSGVQQSRDRLKFLLEQHGETKQEIDSILKNIDILTMRYFGTKHSSDSWKKAMEPYQNIDYIFEDGENKLEAAGQAARELGSDPELYTSAEDFT